MDWVHLFTSFDGRISRQPFWIAWAVLVVGEIVSELITENGQWSAVLDLLLIYPEFAVCTKRGHDRNTPTWVIGLFFGVSAVFDILLLGGWITSATLKNLPTLLIALLAPYSIFALALLIDLGFRRGTVGPNRYGPDPLEAST
jgi:uncharacterized membrane protein YhaH (DUF805 family)